MWEYPKWFTTLAWGIIIVCPPLAVWKLVDLVFWASAHVQLALSVKP